MNKKQKWIFGAVSFLLLLVIAGFGYQELVRQQEKERKREIREKQVVSEKEADEEEEKEYAEAPDFTVWTSQGEETSLKEILDGRPALINFWTSKCPPCKEEMPDFQELYEELGEKVQFILVDGVGCMGETEESGKAYIEEQGFTFPVYYDLEMDAVITYGIQAFPTTYFLNAEGRLVTGGQGMLTKDVVLEGLKMAGAEI